MMLIVRGLDEQFARLHGRSLALVRAVPAERLYWQPPREPAARTFPVYSCGEHLLRSAAAVEQTFGGITVNLWDDPFEWTLPESLPTPDAVARYLEEAAPTRRCGSSPTRACHACEPPGAGLRLRANFARGIVVRKAGTYLIPWKEVR